MALDANSIRLNWEVLGLDFGVFRRAATDPLDQLYHHTGSMPFIHPPTAILLFKPAGMIPYNLIVWTVGSLLAFALAVAAIVGRKATLLSLLSQASVKGLAFGQVPMLLAAGMFTALRFPPVAAGALWGTVAVIKPHLMLFAPLALLVRRDWSMLAAMTVSALLLFILTLILFGPGLWIEWIDAATRFAQHQAMNGKVSRSVSLGGLASVAGYPELPFMFFGAFVGGMAVIYAARHVENERLIALIVAASLIVSPYARTHDTIALIPACAALMLSGHWLAAIPAAMVFTGNPFLAAVGILVGLLMVAAWRIKAEVPDYPVALDPPTSGRSA